MPRKVTLIFGFFGSPFCFARLRPPLRQCPPLSGEPVGVARGRGGATGTSVHSKSSSPTPPLHASRSGSSGPAAACRGVEGPTKYCFQFSSWNVSNVQKGENLLFYSDLDINLIIRTEIGLVSEAKCIINPIMIFNFLRRLHFLPGIWPKLISPIIVTGKLKWLRFRN